MERYRRGMDSTPTAHGPSGTSTPDVVIVMGVSGSGKTSLAKALAVQMGWTFAEGDAFHPAANVEKMAAGHPLTDEDRWPWLQSIHDWIRGEVDAGRSAVVTCSALRRVYRDLLRGDLPQVRFLHPVASFETIDARLQARTGHYMPASLLQSQFDTLEDLQDDEPGVVVSAEHSFPEMLREGFGVLGLTPIDDETVPQEDRR